MFADGSVKSMLLDDSLDVADLVAEIGRKMDIPHADEYSLARLPPDTNLDDGVATHGEWLLPLRTPIAQGIEPDEPLVLAKKYFEFDDEIEESDQNAVSVRWLICVPCDCCVCHVC